MPKTVFFFIFLYYIPLSYLRKNVFRVRKLFFFVIIIIIINSPSAGKVNVYIFYFLTVYYRENLHVLFFFSPYPYAKNPSKTYGFVKRPTTELCNNTFAVVIEFVVLKMSYVGLKIYIFFFFLIFSNNNNKKIKKKNIHTTY